MNKPRRIKIKWSDFSSDMKFIAEGVQKCTWFRRINTIYGIPRGGLVVAVYLSHYLDLPLIVDKSKINKRTLVVDDISDTGKTFKKFLGSKKFRTVAWFEAQDSKFKTDFFARYKYNDWLIFPWESNETSKYDNLNI